MAQNNRYSRQIRFEPIGSAGQNALAGSHAAIIGCGALGSVSAELLARAGVGTLTLIDRDFVEASNLQRQFLFDETDAAEALPKAIAAKQRLAVVNSGVEVHAIVDDLRCGNIRELLADTDVIVDGTDNFETRYLLNDFAVCTGVPWIYGAAVGSYGITIPFLDGGGPCFRCIFPDRPTGAQPTCETAGVLGPVTALIASAQAAVALQILSGNVEAVRRVITTADLWNGPIRETAQPDRDPQCHCCGGRQFEYLEGVCETPVSLCGRNAVQLHSQIGSIDLEMLRDRLALSGPVRANDFALRFSLHPYELTVFPDGRAIIKGTTDVALARSLYAKWISA